MSWDGGRLTQAVIHSKSGLPCKVVCGDQSWEFSTEAGKSYPSARPAGASGQHRSGSKRPLAGAGRAADQGDLRNEHVCHALLSRDLASGRLGLPHAGEAPGASGAEIVRYDSAATHARSWLPARSSSFPSPTSA